MNLFRYKWVIPVLAEIHLTGGTKFATVIHRCGMSRSVLTSTLSHLVNFGLVEKNSGYGHPLRPEYALTTIGAKISPFCSELMTLLEKQNMSQLLQNRWACPIIFHTGEEERGFNEYKKILNPITPRSLSEGLNFLLLSNAIKKDLILGSPPKSAYSLPKKTIQLCEPFKKYQDQLILV